MPNNKKAVLVRQPAAFNKPGSRPSQSALARGLLGSIQQSTSSPGVLSSQSGSVAMTTACRQALVHLLAVKPLDVGDIMDKTHIPKDICMTVLSKIANSDQSSMKWKLTDKAYKELDPYTFKYESADRQTAIDHAVAAFDRQRISKDDKLWQKLNPVTERGSGKTLSKLNLSGPGSSTPVVVRPSTKSNSPANESEAIALSADERPQSKLGATADVRAKQLFNKKRITNKLASSSSSKSSSSLSKTPFDINATVAAVSDSDMARKGVAQRIAGQKRKATDVKFKSDERIDDSDVDDDSLIVREPKKLKTNVEGTTKAKPTSRSDLPAKEENIARNASTPATTMSTKIAGKEITPATAIKKTSAPPSANGFFGAATSAPKLRKVLRAPESDGEKPKTAATVPGDGLTRQNNRQAPEEQQKKKDAADSGKLKPKQPGTTITVKGLQPSPSLPPKPPSRSASSTNVNVGRDSGGKSSTTTTRPGQAAHPRTIEHSANAGIQTQQKQTKQTIDNSQLHKRIPSTSTTSSSSTTSSIFTPPTHRNSTSSSLSSSSSTMALTRSDTRKTAKRANDDHPKEQPLTKKTKKETSKLENSPNSSPLTATSDLASVSTPSQTMAAAHSPLPRPASSSQAQALQAESTSVHSKRLRLASLRTQFHNLFSTWISARVVYHKDETNATDKTIHDMKAYHTRVKNMEVEIRSLMDQVQDFTFWDGVPAKFVTEHEDFLRERLRTLHPVYNEKWDELDKLRESKERDEEYDKLKKEVCKRLEEIEDLQAILHPAQEWEFVADPASVQGEA